MPRLYLMPSLLVLGAFGFWLPLPAGAEYYRYETDNGSLAFTDDPEQIPARYRDSAVAVPEQSLHDWNRTTHVEPAPALPPRAAKASPQRLRQVKSEAAPARDVVTLNGIDGDIDVGVDVTARSDEPIIVEKRVMRSDGIGTVEYTIVRQGDRVLMEIREPVLDRVEP